MKTPISYYGGKQRMATKIIKLIPKHQTYIEPFFGGGAVFWRKEPSKGEVINDKNSNVINFYLQLKTNYKKLKKLIDATLHSRVTVKNASYVLFDNPFATDLDRAWAFWVMCNLTFGHSPKPNNGPAIDNDGSCARSFWNKKKNFTKDLEERLYSTFIECDDAIKVIKKKDKPNAFFYIDPPYVSSVQGPYAGYTHANFVELLDTLKNIKGKFLLSSYPEPVLLEYRDKHNWFSEDEEMWVTVNNKNPKKKLECLTANYSLEF